MAKLKFTPEQRFIIALLCDLHRSPEEREFRPENISLISDAVCGGHDWVIDWEMGMMLPEQIDTEEQVSFVADVLDMWEHIELAWTQFQEADRQKVRDAVPYLKEPKFAGFDGNNEGEYLSIARMLVEKMNRFSSFKGNRSLNSHSHKVDDYRQMLKIWPTVRTTLGRSEMTVDQMTELLSRS